MSFVWPLVACYAVTYFCAWRIVFRLFYNDIGPGFDGSDLAFGVTITTLCASFGPFIVGWFALRAAVRKALPHTTFDKVARRLAGVGPEDE